MAVHVASLVAGFGILVYANRHQWFFNDEWSFLARRGLFGGDLGIFHPHNEHWTTIPIAIFRGIYSVFGIRSYLPYALVLVLLHLVLAHLLWQVLRTVGTDVPLATALVCPFIVLGAGYENLLWAFQIGFVASVALGLVMVLLVNHDGPPGRRDLVAMGVAVVGLMCSGLTITMVVIAGLTVLFRRGVRAAVTFAAVPAAVFMLWFLLVGREGLDAHRRSIDDVFGYPTFIWTGIQTAFERVLGFPGAGAVVVLALGVWLLRRSELAGTRAAPAFAGALGILFLFGVLAVGRTSLGVGEAQAPRYVYTVVALALPAIGLALTELCAGVDVRRAVVFLVLALVALHNLGLLRDVTREEGAREARIRGQILAAAQILSRDGQILSGDGQIVGNLPEPAHSGHLTAAALLRMQRDGKLPGFDDVTEADRLSAQAALQLDLQLSGLAGAQPVAPALTTVSGAVAAPDGQGCVSLTPSSPGPAVELTGAAPLSVTVETSNGGQLTATLRTNGVTGAPRALPVLPAATPVFLNMTASADTLALAIPPQGVTRICGLRT